MSEITIFSKLFEGFWLNCIIFFSTLALSLPLGLLISFGSMSKLKFIRYTINTIVWIIRGSPLMLQIIFIFYVPPLTGLGNPWAYFGVNGRIIAICVAFIINYACYFSEIFRGGIQSIPKGQYEAGLVLGMTKPQIFFKITLLQVIKRVIPPMGNEFMTLIKDTALANILATREIILIAKEFTATNGLIWPLFSTAIFFLIFCGVLTWIFNWLEKKMDYFRV